MMDLVRESDRIVVVVAVLLHGRREEGGIGSDTPWVVGDCACEGT